MKNKTISLCCTLLFVLAAACGSLLQAQNSTLSVQGVLRKSDGAAVPDGQYSLTFRLWDAATNGTAVHTETQSSVQVTGGIYSTLLGTTTAMTAPFDKPYYLGVTVGAGQELIPRAQLSSAPYTLAIRGQSNVVPSNGSVGVGTLQPKSKLDVEGGLAVGATYSGATAAPANGAIIEGKVGIGTSSVPSDAVLQVGTRLLTVRTDGRTGINHYFTDVALNVRGVTGDYYHFNVEKPDGTDVFSVLPNGNSYTQGNVTASGSKQFVIDHPLDPANKVLTHICIESPEAFNLYQGLVTLDANGEAWVELPEYYDALNKDSRYQLTCVGGWAQVYIAEEVKNNRFRIAGGVPGMKVSWQVTGTRNDPWMRDNKPAVERLKKGEEAGTYFYPAGYGQPAEKSYGRNKAQTPDN